MRQRLAAACLLAIAIVGPCPWPQAWAAEPASDGAIAVSVLHPASRCFEDRVTASGVLVARRAVEVRPDRDGLVVSEVLVEAGDVVAEDQVLARLVSPKTPQEKTPQEKTPQEKTPQEKTPQAAVALRAPAPGVITAASAVVGAYAAAGAGDPLFRIAENGELQLKAATPATNLSRLRAGMAARLRVVGGGAVEGRVASLGDGIDARSQLAGLRLAVAIDPRLRIGSFARAEIAVGQDCGLAVPLSAVRFAAGGTVAGVVQGGRVVMRRVTTGLVQGGSIEIRDGLSADDLVIARAAPFLRDGDPVRPAASP